MRINPIKNNNCKANYLLLLVSMLIASSSFSIAQTTSGTETEAVETKYSEQELQKFITINQKIVELQDKSQEKMLKAVADANMEVERFNQLAEAHQNNTLDKASATDEELTSFNNISEKIMEEQNNLNNQIVQILEEEGVPVEKFEEMIMAYQQDPQMQDDINKIMQQN